MSITTNKDGRYSIECAHCGTKFTAWDDDESDWWSREDWLLEWWDNDESGCWHLIDEKPYCDDCVYFDDDGEKLLALDQH